MRLIFCLARRWSVLVVVTTRTALVGPEIKEVGKHQLNTPQDTQAVFHLLAQLFYGEGGTSNADQPSHPPQRDPQLSMVAVTADQSHGADWDDAQSQNLVGHFIAS